MIKLRLILKSKAVKAWMIVSSVLLGFAFALTIVAACIPWCYNGMNSLFGGERRVLESGNPSEYMRYQADYPDKKATLAAANALNERICEEGIVLLKNEDETLPLRTRKISIFGKNSVNPVMGGSGSGASMGGVTVTDLYAALSAAGFDCNPALKNFYESSVSGPGRPSVPGYGSILTGFPIGETPLASYTQTVRDSYDKYGDAAIVFLSRIGGEGYDLPRTMFWNGGNYTTWSGKQLIPGARSIDDHYLQLDRNETDMIREVCENFSSVTLIINSSAPLELGFLDDPAHYAFRKELKAALWIGNPGGSGLNALGRILTGGINPSGRTVDTFARNFKDDPTWENFGNNLAEGGNGYTLDNEPRNAYFVEYEEGIYVGYRYYETRGYTEKQSGNPEWYDKNVVYPFGHGKSYTTFDWEIMDTSIADGSALQPADTISVTVRVTNTGAVYAGRDVVQLYYTPPYTGGVEKARVVLGGFAKTKEIAPGGSDEVTIALRVRDTASYDYNDADNNDFFGYEAEEGTYQIAVTENAHGGVNHFILNYTVPKGGFRYEKDDVTQHAVENLFDDVSGHIEKYLSRSSWTQTWPTRPSAADRAVDRAFIDSLSYAVNDHAADPWYADTAPSQSSKMLDYSRTIKLWELIGADGAVDFGDRRWSDFLNQLTVPQMAELISVGHFRTIQITNIDKPLTTDADGPAGFAAFVGDPTIYDVGYYAGACVLSATRNPALAAEFGVMIGNEAIIGNEKGDGRPYSGWYAPAVNTHRSQFGGRNFEYYSEDGRLAGIMAAAVIRGASSKGVYTYVKHFALNDQETDRDTTGLLTWANEQAMRELYFVPFEMAVKKGGTTAIMSAFNRVGTVWAGGDYRLLTQLLRDEWGFRGTVVTDYNASRYMDADQMIRAGGDLNLSPSKTLSSVSTATEITALRRATKNILYTVAGSNAMNGMGVGVLYRYAMPYWLIGLIVSDVVLCSLSVVVGVFVNLRSIGKNVPAA